MLELNYESCTGCGLCENVCPTKAIKMVKNHEGFYYPVVNEDLCVKCSKCNISCPINKENIPEEDRKFYAIYSKDDVERSKSSTGGMCAMVARHIINQGGFFCGAAFCNGNLEHRLTNSFAFFDKYMRGSKYFQSRIGNIYVQILNLLNEGKTVAFVGTPCQVNGLRLFLGKIYENLYLIDLICHGVPSQKVFDKFLESNQLKQYINDNVSINFRDKKTGWHVPSLVIRNENSILYDKEMDRTPFFKAFLSDICLRKSCYLCPYTSIWRVSDIMVGDFWGCPQNIDDNKGINLISVNKKGLSLLNKIKNENAVFLKKYSVDKVLQPQLCKPVQEHFYREKFFKNLDKLNFNNLISQAFDKKKKVALLNFHWENNNYGAVLTSYALNVYVNSLGFDAYNIDYIPFFGKNSLSTSNFDKFRAKYLPLTQKCDSLYELKLLNKNFETFIVGSDQVFNYEFVAKCKEIYYLGFVDEENKKIAYAASFGRKDFLAPDIEINKIGLLLSRFNRIGVREKSGVDLCRNVFRLKAVHVLDPVFLLPKEKWEDIARRGNVKKGKRIYYIVNQDLNNEADKHLKDFESIRYALSIEDWLASLENASFVITDSFHAVCFCLIFNKQFVFVAKGNGREERIESLFEMFDIPKTLFWVDSKLDVLKNYNFSKIDYSNFNEKLEKWLDISKKFIEEALSCENEKMYDPYYFRFKKCQNHLQWSSDFIKLRFQFYKYKIFYNFSLGKARKKYEQKYKEIKRQYKDMKKLIKVCL